MSNPTPLPFIFQLPRALRPLIYLRYQTRLLTHSSRLRNPNQPSKPPPPNPQTLEYRTSDRKEKSETLNDVVTPNSEDQNPHLLGRPIGMPFPPSPGENSGQDTRPMRERLATILSREQNQQRRSELRQAMFQKPYFRDWSNMKWHEGKTFRSNPRLFRRDRGMWFPNFVGETLVPGSSGEESTTEVMRGKVSVVCVYSSEWAYQQVDSFVGKKQNPGVREVLEANGNLAQRVDINVEESAARYWILRPFFARLRKERRSEDYGKYFVVRKGITDQIRESIGSLNSKVGYVYLVDGDCKIRWAGSGPSWPEEREGFVKGLQKMILEARQDTVDDTGKQARLAEVDINPSGEAISAQGMEPRNQVASVSS
ncbi:MAG: hypothetical protein Q9165_005069 [Trypethelium subeluteriae]